MIDRESALRGRNTPAPSCMPARKPLKSRLVRDRYSQLIRKWADGEWKHNE